MDIADLLLQKEFSLPQTRPDKRDLFDVLNELNNSYIDNINNLNSNDPVTLEVKKRINVIEEFRDAIYSAFYLCYTGHRSEAKNILHNTISKHQNLIFNLQSGDLEPKHLNKMYRARQKESGKNFTTKEMLHIPFEERYKVGTWRYSMPGLPCLYLGSSVYICCKECKKEIDELQVSRFETTNNINLLDLGYTPDYIASVVKKFIGADAAELKKLPFIQTVARCLLWPLLAACSFQPPDYRANFKSEYLIPNLLLEIITDFHKKPILGVIGIRYFSVRYLHGHFSPIIMNNFVFPIQNVGVNGHCVGLLSNFKVTSPLDFDKITKAKLPTPSASKELIDIGNIQLKVDAISAPIPYSSTDYHQLEIHLESTPASPC